MEEPFVFFLGRNILVAAGFLLFSYLMASYKGLPNVLIVMFALIVLYAFVTSSMTIGRRIYALGGNEKAARLSGIKTHRLTFYTFANMGLLAGLAGLIFAARLNTATPKAGLGFELDVIAACFIGGASASGGVGKVVGAVIGAFVMGVMNNGMSILGVGIDLQQVIKGLVLLAAVFLDVYYKNKASSRISSWSGSTVCPRRRGIARPNLDGRAKHDHDAGSSAGRPQFRDGAGVVEAVDGDQRHQRPADAAGAEAQDGADPTVAEPAPCRRPGNPRSPSARPLAPRCEAGCARRSTAPAAPPTSRKPSPSWDWPPS